MPTGNGFRSPKSGKHSKGHGKPKKRRKFPPPLVTAPKKPQRDAAEYLFKKPMSELEAWVRLGVLLEERLGYSLTDRDDW